MTVKSPPNLEITLTFSAGELVQLEAFATLHGVSVSEFIHRAALDQAQISQKPRAQAAGADWLADTSATSSMDDVFAIETPQLSGAAKKKTKSVTAPFAPEEESQSSSHIETSAKNRGTAGVASSLARGSGPVWEIRQALGKERVHGLGWTREQLAFVLKMSVVGVRKMEHTGKSPSKSLDARRSLLTLAQTLEAPSPQIAAFIAREVADLGQLN